MSGKWLKLMLVFSICLNIGFLAMASVGYYKHRNDPRFPPRMKKFSSSVVFKTVDLTSQQKEELEQLGDLMQARMAEIGKTALPLKISIMKQLAKPKPLDKQKLEELSRQLVNIQGKRDIIVPQHLKDVRSLLTDEQAEKVFTRFAEIQQKWGDKYKPLHRK